jgi:hypothetical protein
MFEAYAQLYEGRLRGELVRFGLKVPAFVRQGHLEDGLEPVRLRSLAVLQRQALDLRRERSNSAHRCLFSEPNDQLLREHPRGHPARPGVPVDGAPRGVPVIVRARRQHHRGARLRGGQVAHRGLNRKGCTPACFDENRGKRVFASRDQRARRGASRRHDASCDELKTRLPSTRVFATARRGVRREEKHARLRCGTRAPSKKWLRRDRLRKNH